MSDAPQTFENHSRMVPAYHYVLGLLILVTLIGSVVNLFNAIGGEGSLYSASLLVVLTIAVFMTAFFARAFALKAQDRVIRLEENVRSQRLTGSPLDSRLTTRQIIGLRFASDEEFSALAARAADENLGEKDIKKAVKNWRADHDRV